MFFRADTPLPPFFPFPKFLLEQKISLTAKVVYALLLGRVTLSQKTGWVSEGGEVYVVYPVKSMASDLGKSERAIKTALQELEAAGLVARIRQGLNKPNRIFLKLPDEVQFSSPRKCNICPSDGQFSAYQDGQTLPPIYNDQRKINRTKLKEGETPSPALGDSQNVFLTDGQLAKLQAEYPRQYRDYINRLSAYMASTGKGYADHYATICKWIAEDAQKKRRAYNDTDDEGGYL